MEFRYATLHVLGKIFDKLEHIGDPCYKCKLTCYKDCRYMELKKTNWKGFR